MKTLKTLSIGIVALVSVLSAPVIPEEMEFAYAYQYIPSQRIEEPTEIVTATGTVQRNIEPSPVFADEDGNDLVSVAVFINLNGEKVFVQISEERYAQMGVVGGYAANPTKNELVNLFQALATEAEAAIAFDSKLNSSSLGAGISHTKPFTNTAGNIVIVGILITNTTTTISDAQYDGVAMTAVTGSPLNTGGGAGGNEQISMYWIVGAATGANNITFTTSASVNPVVGAVSYSGASTTGQPDAEDTEVNAGTTDLTLTMTTVTDDAWLVGYWRNAYEAAVAGANTTFRTDANNTIPLGDRGPVTPAGSFTVIAHDDNSRDWSGIGMAIKPAAVATPEVKKQDIIWFNEE